MFSGVLRHRSGRVIALGRTLLAAIFLFAIWVDPTQPVQSPGLSYLLLAVYVALAAAITVATWNDWWLEAKLAAPGHLIDIVAFTLLVFATDGYTSPFFLFFLFLILSAAIRWGWVETTATAIAVVLLYLAAGLVAGALDPGAEFELQRFIVRSAHLLILSAILIWFGVNPGFSGIGMAPENFLVDAALDDSPIESAIRGAARLTNSATAVLLWRATTEPNAESFRLTGDKLEILKHPVTPLFGAEMGRPFLMRVRSNRALTRTPERRLRFFRPSHVLDPAFIVDMGMWDALAIPLDTPTGSGILLLGGIEGLCTDHIELGYVIARAVAAHLQRHALLNAVSESAIASARQSLSRDLHDSIVQFLAGATFKVEAISRSEKAGEEVAGDLADLKRLLLEEQRELRSAIGVLRANTVGLRELGADLAVLCDRLSRQWGIECTFHADLPEVAAPMRLHLDSHHLVREAVANAVRHARAKSVDVGLSSDLTNLLLEVVNDGTMHERAAASGPWSLRERVDEANGSLMLASRDNRTTVSITLPLT